MKQPKSNNGARNLGGGKERTASGKAHGPRRRLPRHRSTLSPIYPGAAYPAADPVTPEDLIATIYHRLGVDPHALIHDRQDRPFPLADGRPILGLL